MSTPETSPETQDNDDVLDSGSPTPDTGTDDSHNEAPESAEKAPKDGLFEQVTNIFGKGLVETAKVEALTLAAKGYALKNKRAVEILDGLDAQTQMELVEKGVTGIELSTFQKILLVVNPGMVILPETLKALWNGFKRNTLAKVIPDAWINDISWLTSQTEVVAMFSTGVVNAKSPEIAQAADQVLMNFIKNTGTTAKIAKVGGTLAGQPEIVEGAEMVKKGADIAKEVVVVFPKVREKMEAKRAEVAEVAKAQVKEHNEVAAADPQAHIPPLPAANNPDNYDKKAAI